MMIDSTPPATSAFQHGSSWEVLAVFTRLGLTSFGGPIAHRVANQDLHGAVGRLQMIRATSWRTRIDADSEAATRIHLKITAGQIG